MEKGFVICDTNIFIHWFNNDPDTINRLLKLGPEKIALSVVTYMELIAGVDNQKQLNQLKKKFRNYPIIDFNEDVSRLTLEFIEKHHLSHRLQIPDAIIAATSVVYNLPLFTYNIKDFKYLPVDLYSNH